MNNDDFLQSPIDMAAFFHDAVAFAVKHEDEDDYLDWVRTNIHAYSSAPVAIDAEALRAMGLAMARMIWNSTPLPSNHFKPRPMVQPGRNQPCWCGSGRKFKHCCAHAPAMPAIDPGAIWAMVLKQLDSRTIKRAIQEKRVPVSGLNMAAQEHIEAGHPKKASMLLSPLFEPSVQRTDDDAEYALTLLCNALDDLGHHNKKMRLLQTVAKTVPRSPLRSGAWQRLAMIRMDRGDNDGAWAAFHQAQRDDPQSTSLGLLEVQLLNAAGENDKARQRAAFWVRQMQRAGMAEDEPAMAFMRRLAENPEATLAEFGLQAAGEAGEGLRQWLVEVKDRALPHYRIDGDSESQNSLEATRQRLEQMGLDALQIEHALADIREEIASTGSQELFDRSHDDDMHTLQTPAALVRLEREWHRLFPLAKPFSIHETPGVEVDPWEPATEQAWCQWLQAHPEACDSLDILDDLATAVVMHAQFGAAWVYDDLLLPLIDRAAAIIDHALANAGDVRLSWIIADNRPALRALARGVFYMQYGRRDEAAASQRAQLLLRLNPDDNHGMRSMVMNQLLRSGKDEEAIRLAANYPGDMHPEIAYGNVLALYRLGRTEDAAQALREVRTRLDKIPRYLITKRIRKPRLNPDGISIGGDDQAWLYREAMRDVWQHAEGALAWLKAQSS